MKQYTWLPIVTILAFCVNKELYKAISYLQTQIDVMIENHALTDKRLILTNSQRIRLAAKAKKLSRKMLNETTRLFTPDTILGWYHKLIAKKYDGSKNRSNPGRPVISDEIIALVLKFKTENHRWGYLKIRDQIEYLGFMVSKNTVKSILIKHGFDPFPNHDTPSRWNEFIKSHWHVLAACDFFTIELMTPHGLVRCTVFFVIELATRKVWFAPIKLQPNGDYMKQVARLLADCEDGFLNKHRYLICDRDPLFTNDFRDIIKTSDAKTKMLKLPAKSPNLNSYAERFVRTIKSGCLNHFILPDVKTLEYTISEFQKYYHHERIHQGIGKIIDPIYKLDDKAKIQTIERLGGLLKSYHRLAA